jgi:hypothetical protein
MYTVLVRRINQRLPLTLGAVTNLDTVKRSIGRGVRYAQLGRWKYLKILWYFATALLGLAGAIQTIMAMFGIDTKLHPGAYVLMAVAVLTHLSFQRDRPTNGPPFGDERNAFSFDKSTVDMEGIRVRNHSSAVKARNSKIAIRDMDVE